MTRHIFVLVQDSAESRLAWRWALANTIREQDHVSLVTIAQPDFPTIAVGAGVGLLDSGATLDAELEALEYSKKQAKQLAHKLLDELAALAIPEGQWTLDTHVVLQEGKSVADTLCSYLAKHNADEAIIGQRSIGSFKRTMLALIGKGSVSDHVVHHAPCSVIVVRPTQDDQAYDSLVSSSI